MFSVIGSSVQVYTKCSNYWNRSSSVHTVFKLLVPFFICSYSVQTIGTVLDMFIQSVQTIGTVLDIFLQCSNYCYRSWHVHTKRSNHVFSSWHGICSYKLGTAAKQLKLFTENSNYGQSHLLQHARVHGKHTFSKISL